MSKVLAGTKKGESEMKLEINGNEIRVKGKNHGDKKSLKIVVIEEEGEDRFQMSVIKNGMEHGCIPTVTIYNNDIVFQSVIPEGRSLL